MTDFDFDELDKAVSGALGTDNKAADVPNGAQPTPQSVPSAAQPQEPLEQPSVTFVAPAARRSSGRFMDMVHPSSNMRSRDTTPASSQLGRDGALEPMSNSSEMPAEQSSTSSPSMGAFGSAVPSEQASMPVNPVPETPFLPDAKVEKRPLGGALAFNDELTFEDLKPEANDDTNKDATPLTAEMSEALQPTEPTMALDAPEELASLPAPEPEEALPVPETPELLDTAEASAMLEEVEPQVSDESKAEEQSQDAAMPQGNETTVEASPSVETTATPVVPEAVPAGPASITQQYTEQPSSAKETGAIYDTDSYHKPITPAPKKKSGLWVLLWIILLVIAGAGAGAAFYVYVLPML